MKSASGHLMSAVEHRHALVKLLLATSRQHDRYRVFSDFVEFAALSISNAVDPRQRAEREAQYLQGIKRYDRDDAAAFPAMLSHLVMALEREPHDALGAVFGEMELGNAARGQFFTPDTICRLMADLTVGDETEAHVREHGYVTVHEPAVGAGAMVIALARTMTERGMPHQRCMHVTAIDVDPRAAHMAYVQFSLLYIPAIVVIGNALTLEQRAVFYTPAHIMDGWAWRLRNRPAGEPVTITPFTGMPAVDNQLDLFAEAAA